jgi:putative acyl-CoA dehydrogenase
MDGLKDDLAALLHPSGDGAVDAQFRARRITEDLAVALQGSLLVRNAPAAVADAFCASRLNDGAAGRAYGTLPVGVDAKSIVERVLPV